MLHAAAGPPRLSTLVLLSALSTSSMNMFLPSLANMAQAFGASYARLSLAVSGYLAVTAVLQLIIGPCADRFGRRPVLLAGLAIFTGASLGCALSTDVGVFLAFRVMQGTVIAGWAVSLAVIRDTAPPREAASVMGYVSMSMALAPMLGPMLGGTLDQLFGWRATFVFFFAAGLALLILCWFDLGETNRSRSATFAIQLRSYPALLHAAPFWGYALCTAFSIGGFYVFLAGAPLVAGTIYGLTPAMVGLCIGAITAGFMLGSFLSGRLARHFALSTMMLAGRTVACAGLGVGLLLLLAGVSHVGVLFGATVFFGMGNGLTTPSSNAGALSVRPELAGSAAGLSGALTLAGGALLTSLGGALITPHNGDWALLAIMLLVALAGLASALLVRRIERG